ncbi:hypothetical protein PGT21_025585 [Puccinia graminis f. sp. tritici]|uniref:Uncharacterized protein n=1 Tax=Puccinia graminis f. sp. tritici TaxID=56615 RepID=A0A5B0R372_PUCGR|nr:hypothetical protein PGT21_025585 [Puccinia graminis f. sp. tritici]
MAHEDSCDASVFGIWTDMKCDEVTVPSLLGTSMQNCMEPGCRSFAHWPTSNLRFTHHFSRPIHLFHSTIFSTT